MCLHCSRCLLLAPRLCPDGEGGCGEKCWRGSGEAALLGKTGLPVVLIRSQAGERSCSLGKSCAAGTRRDLSLTWADGWRVSRGRPAPSWVLAGQLRSRYRLLQPFSQGNVTVSYGRGLLIVGQVGWGSLQGWQGMATGPVLCTIPAVQAAVSSWPCSSRDSFPPAKQLPFLLFHPLCLLCDAGGSFYPKNLPAQPREKVSRLFSALGREKVLCQCFSMLLLIHRFPFPWVL